MDFHFNAFLKKYPDPYILFIDLFPEVIFKGKMGPFLFIELY